MFGSPPLGWGSARTHGCGARDHHWEGMGGEMVAGSDSAPISPGSTRKHGWGPRRRPHSPPLLDRDLLCFDHIATFSEGPVSRPRDHTHGHTHGSSHLNLGEARGDGVHAVTTPSSTTGDRHCHPVSVPRPRLPCQGELRRALTNGSTQQRKSERRLPGPPSPAEGRDRNVRASRAEG